MVQCQSPRDSGANNSTKAILTQALTEKSLSFIFSVADDDQNYHYNILKNIKRFREKHNVKYGTFSGLEIGI